MKHLLIWLLATIFLTTASVTEAQQPTKIAKIGEVRNRPGIRTRSELFLQTLGELGYVEGKNIAFETRYHENKFDRLPAWLTSWSVSKLTFYGLVYR